MRHSSDRTKDPAVFWRQLDKVKEAFEERGLKWPPNLKSKKK
jgi:hypothetical protein